MYKIYKENNYIVVIDTIKNEWFYGHAKNVFVDKSNKNKLEYIIENIKNFSDKIVLKIGNILKQNGDIYTQSEWESFYKENTGFNSASGGSGAISDGDKGDITVSDSGSTWEINEDASVFSFVLDEDDMSSDSATKVPTQQSVKAYVDDLIADTLPTGGYVGTAQDLKDDVDGAISGYQGPIYIADTKTVDGIYSPMEAGTYPNAGGLIYAPDTTDEGKIVQFIKTGASWVKHTVDVSIDLDGLISKNVLFAENDIFKIDGFMRPNGTISTTSSYIRSDYIDISGVTKIYIHTTPGSTSVSPCVFFDSSFTYISGITPPSNLEQDFVITEIPSNAKYIVTSMLSTGFYSFMFNVDKAINPNLKDEVFVSTTGDDYTGDGSSTNPFKTYTKAKFLLKEGGTVVFKEGDYTPQSYASFNISTNIKANSGERVRLLFGDRIETAPLESGYTRVYSATYSSSIAAGYYLWQHDIDDVDTEILDTERHPLHNGKTYRLGSTRIYPASSIAEIESTTDKLMWYKSGSTLYFSKASGSNLSVNPIVVPSSKTISIRKDIRMENINVLYTPIITNQTNSFFKNVTAGFVNNAGALRFNDSIGCVFEKCAFYASSNDGANGHGTEPMNIFSNRTEAIFRECWFHDNSDDGESCHQYSQTTHYGSLAEYNGNGITPASGGHSVCHNSTVRRNGSHPWSVGEEGSGFSAQGAPLDNGESTDIWCYGCLSKNNGIGFRAQNVGNTFINCISKDDTVAFAGTSNQINCVTI